MKQLTITRRDWQRGEGTGAGGMSGGIRAATTRRKIFMGKKMQAVVKIDRWSDQAGGPKNSLPRRGQVRGQAHASGAGAGGAATTAGAKPGVDEAFNDAIFFSQTQEELLQKVRTALHRMQELAALAQEQPRTPPAAFASEYHTLTCFLSNIASKEIRGQRLFGQKHLVLDLDEAGNKLVMGGIDLGGPVFTGVISSNIASPINASRALVKIQAAQEELAIHQSVAAANQSRLVFLSKDRELLQASPRPAADLMAVVGREDENAPPDQSDERSAPPHELLTVPKAKAA